MRKTSAESVLISAIINSGDPSAASSYGITTDHLVGYRDEYTWVLSYYDRYGHMPTEDSLLAMFPGFPLSGEDTDARWSAHEISESFATRMAMKAIMSASELLRTNQPREAIALLNAVGYRDATARPKPLLDPGYLEDYESPREIRVPTPYPTLQLLTNGIGPGELWYWAARPRQGKSNFLVDIGCEAAYRGQRVLMFSLEMTRRQCQVRFHATMGRRLEWGNKIDAVAMLRREYPLPLYRQLLGDISDAVPGTFDIHDTSDGFATPASVMRYASEYDLILIDYVGLMRLENGSRAIDDWRCAATVSNGLKEAAMAKGGRILAASQINRDGDTNGWAPPKLKHMAQTDALGQDGDVVLTMKRYGRNAEVIRLEKNRHGDGDRLFFTRYLPNIGDFTEVDRGEADDLRDEEPFDE